MRPQLDYRGAGCSGSRHPCWKAWPRTMSPRTAAVTTMTTKTKPPALLGQGSVNEGSAMIATTTPMTSDSQKYRLRLAINPGMAEV